MANKDEHVFKVEADNLEYTFGASSSQAEPSPTKLTPNGFHPDESSDKGTPHSGRLSTPRSVRSDTSFDFTFGPGGHPCAQNSPVERSWDCAQGHLAEDGAYEATDAAPALAVDSAQNHSVYPSTVSHSEAQAAPAPISYYSKIADASYSSDPGIAPYCPVPPAIVEQYTATQQHYAATQEHDVATQEHDVATQEQYPATQQEYTATEEEDASAQLEYAAAQLKYEAECAQYARENAPQEASPSTSCCTIL